MDIKQMIVAAAENVVTVIGITLIAIYAPGWWKLLVFVLAANLNMLRIRRKQ